MRKGWTVDDAYVFVDDGVSGAEFANRRTEAIEFDNHRNLVSHKRPPRRIDSADRQIAQGLGGLMSVTGEPGHGPMRVGIAVADSAAGLYCALG